MQYEVFKTKCVYDTPEGHNNYEIAIIIKRKRTKLPYHEEKNLKSVYNYPKKNPIDIIIT